MHAKDLAKIIKLSIDNKITENFNVATKKIIQLRKLLNWHLKHATLKRLKFFLIKICQMVK